MPLPKALVSLATPGPGATQPAPADPVDYSGADVFDDAPFVIITGDSGVGKSLTAARAYPGAHFICASPTALHSYAAWCLDNWDKPDGPKALNLRTPVIPNPRYDPAKPPNAKTNPRAFRRSFEDGGLEITVMNAWGFNNAGEPARTETRKTLASMFTEFAKLAHQGMLPWDAIVLDEYSEFMRRIETDIDEDRAFGKDHYARMDAVKAEHDFYCDITRTIGVPVVALCHYRGPTYYDSESDRGNAWAGNLKYKGGPALPMGKMLEPMVQKSDLCFTMVQETAPGGMKRFFLTHGTDTRFGKRRGELKDKEPADLRAALRAAYYRA